jgi:CRP-like cAMP-binding protein
MSKIILNDPEITKIAQGKFQFLDSAERDFLFSHAHLVILEQEQILSHQGDIGDSFFIILSGELRATRQKNRTPAHTF